MRPVAYRINASCIHRGRKMTSLEQLCWRRCGTTGSAAGTLEWHNRFLPCSKTPRSNFARGQPAFSKQFARAEVGESDSRDSAVAGLPRRGTDFVEGDA